MAKKMQEMRSFSEIFNFSDENPIVVLELVNLIYKLVGMKPNYKILNKAKHEVKYQYLSFRKAREILGCKTSYILNVGPNRVIDWYEQKILKIPEVFSWA